MHHQVITRSSFCRRRRRSFSCQCMSCECVSAEMEECGADTAVHSTVGRRALQLLLCLNLFEDQLSRERSVLLLSQTPTPFVACCVLYVKSFPKMLQEIILLTVVCGVILSRCSNTEEGEAEIFLLHWQILQLVFPSSDTDRNDFSLWRVSAVCTNLFYTQRRSQTFQTCQICQEDFLGETCLKTLPWNISV